MTPDDTSPLGKSVEEVEQDSSNRVNSPVSSEERRDEDGIGIVPAVAPIGGVAGTGVTSGVPAAIINPGGMVDADQAGADDGRNNVDRDSSEE